MCPAAPAGVRHGNGITGPPVRSARIGLAMGMLGAGAAVAGVPVAALLLLLAMRWAPVAPIVLAIGVTVLAAILFALRWARDVDILSDTVRRAGADEPALQSGHSPVLPGMQRLADDLGRLTRRTVARSALIEQLRRTD